MRGTPEWTRSTLRRLGHTDDANPGRALRKANDVFEDAHRRGKLDLKNSSHMSDLVHELRRVLKRNGVDATSGKIERYAEDAIRGAQQ